MNYVFIVGCPRSGTSILGELVACHKKVKYFFETRNVWQKERVNSLQKGAGNNLHSHRLIAKDYNEEGVKRIRHFFESREMISNPLPRRFIRFLLNRFQIKQVVVEKNPRNALRIPYILSVFPNAKFIHIIRDGRDVTCSLLPGIGGKEWNHARPDNWLELSKFSALKRCALTWQEIILTADRDLKDLTSTSKHLIKYEDLLNNTWSETFRLFNFLELKITPKIKTFIDKIQNETKHFYHAEKQVHWYRPNHSVRIGRWRENLTPDEQREVFNLIEDTLNYFGYI